MKSKKKGDEFSLVRQLHSILESGYPTGKNVLCGIGDDAAWTRSSAKQQVITTDALVEGVHFDRQYMSFEDIGYKSMAVNVSDIAAMGAVPSFAVIALQINPQTPNKNIHALYRGITTACRLYNVQVIGGNISRSSTFSITVTLIGNVPERKKPWLRSDARIGDVIAVTGDLGGSAAGLMLYHRLEKKYNYALQRHSRPNARLDWSQLLQQRNIQVHAAIDISDGLSSDLNHVCIESGCGAQIEAACIPIHSEIKKLGNLIKKDPLMWALHGGEDYELLITMPPKEFIKAKKILKTNIHAIGTIVNGTSVVITDPSGNRKTLEPAGFRHF